MIKPEIGLVTVEWMGRVHHGLEVHGTEESLMWNFERMNELRLAVGRGSRADFTTIYADPGFSDVDHFQPGTGAGMGYDDVKVIEAKKNLTTYAGMRNQPCASIRDALAAAQIIAAAKASAIHKAWQTVTPTSGTSAVEVPIHRAVTA